MFGNGSMLKIRETKIQRCLWMDPCIILKTSTRHNLLVDRRGLRSLKGGYFKDREKDGKPIWYFNRIGFLSCIGFFG